MEMRMEVDAITESLDYEPEIPVLLLEPMLMLSKKLLKIMK
jgi:hypothetical protein